MGERDTISEAERMVCTHARTQCIVRWADVCELLLTLIFFRC